MASSFLAAVAVDGLLLVLQRPLLLRHWLCVLATFAVEVHRHDGILRQLSVLDVNLIELIFRPAAGIFASELPTSVCAFPIAVLYQLWLIGGVAVRHEIAGILRVLLAHLQPSEVDVGTLVFDVGGIESVVHGHFRLVNLRRRDAPSS